MGKELQSTVKKNPPFSAARFSAAPIAATLLNTASFKLQQWSAAHDARHHPPRVGPHALSDVASTVFWHYNNFPGSMAAGILGASAVSFSILGHSWLRPQPISRRVACAAALTVAALSGFGVNVVQETTPGRNAAITVKDIIPDVAIPPEYATKDPADAAFGIGGAVMGGAVVSLGLMGGGRRKETAEM
ncbi:MAG TPA: hypothetical protein VMY99_03860 [Nevskiaceae bacterium]|nr:hypothetical protein [Nevskiaceae bacterium]